MQFVISRMFYKCKFIVWLHAESNKIHSQTRINEQLSNRLQRRTF